MNRFILTILAITFVHHALAQKVSVGRATQKVSNETAEGYQTDLRGTAEYVRSAWFKFLKDSGKGKLIGEKLIITEPIVGGNIFAKGVLYATTVQAGEAARVWLGLIPSEWDTSGAKVAGIELEQLVYRFGVKFYKDEIQKQIDESEAAVQAVERQSQRLVNESRSLTKSLSNNDEEKVQLEKSLEENKLEDFVLRQKIVNNKKAQDSVAQAGVQIRKVVEMHKERQAKVN